MKTILMAALCLTMGCIMEEKFELVEAGPCECWSEVDGEHFCECDEASDHGEEDPWICLDQCEGDCLNDCDDEDDCMAECLGDCVDECYGEDGDSSDGDSSDEGSDGDDGEDEDDCD